MVWKWRWPEDIRVAESWDPGSQDPALSANLEDIFSKDHLINQSINDLVLLKGGVCRKTCVPAFLAFRNSASLLNVFTGLFSSSLPLDYFNFLKNDQVEQISFLAAVYLKPYKKLAIYQNQYQTIPRFTYGLLQAHKPPQLSPFERETRKEKWVYFHPI